ncbi:MAG: putative quinol monooxygenase [Flavobacterium sp.]|jgi:autoinducer 2-degrading protein
MLVRIVKLTIKIDQIDVFLENFNQIKETIKNFEGNELLELYQDKDNPTIFYTYSYWKSEELLNKYRKSAFFDKVWNYTKQLFEEKAVANSLHLIHSLK